MAITAYVGLPRHGKSYGVVENVIVPALKQKRVVYTNIPMKSENCIERFGVCPVPFDMKDIQDNPDWFQSEFEKGSIIVLDECWRLWSSGLKANNALEQHKSFLAEHGHMVGNSGFTTEIVLVTQDLSQVAHFVRTLVNTTYRVTKLEGVNQDEKFRLDVYQGHVTGQAPPVSKRTREIFGSRKQEIYDLYVSQTMSEVGHGNETRTDKRFNILAGGKMKAVIGSFFLFAFMAGYLIYTFVTTSPLLDHDDSIPDSSDKTLKEQVSERSALKPPGGEINKELVSKVQTQEVKKIDYNLDILSRSNDVVLLGHLDGIRFYKVVVDNNYSILSADDLIKLGYSLEPINNCLTVITGFKKTFYSLCKDPDSNYNGFLSNTISS